MKCKSVLLSILFLFIFSSSIFAQSATKSASSNTAIKAFIPDIYLFLSGMASPYATVILDSQKVILSSTVADSQGSFSFSSIVIQRGSNQFCLKVVDLRQLGSSTTCIDVSPAEKDIIMENLFLPPTTGVSRAIVEEGGTVDVYGYSMPDAWVILDLGKAGIYSVLADASGYYKITLVKALSGKHKLLVVAYYQKLKSLLPTFPLILTSLSFFSQISQRLGYLGVWLGVLVCIAIVLFVSWFVFRNKLYKNKRFRINPKFARNVFSWFRFRH